MKIFTKTQLQLRERTIKKKDVVLKEYDINNNVGYNNINGIANSLTNNGKVNIVANPDKNVINATVLSKDNHVTADEVKQQLGDTIATAKRNNADINVQGVQVPNGAKKIGTNTSSSELPLSEHILTKNDLNKFLRTL